MLYIYYGDYLKTYFKISLVAVVLGIILSFIFYVKLVDNSNVNNLINDNNKVYVFQVGVFKSLDNAKKFMNTFISGGYYKKDDLYHVIVAVTKNNSKLIASTLKDENINFVIKEEFINNDKINKLVEYDKAFRESKNLITWQNINKSSVELFIQSCT